MIFFFFFFDRWGIFILAIFSSLLLSWFVLLKLFVNYLLNSSFIGQNSIITMQNFYKLYLSWCHYFNFENWHPHTNTKNVTTNVDRFVHLFILQSWQINSIWRLYFHWNIFRTKMAVQYVRTVVSFIDGSLVYSGILPSC